MRTFSYQLYSSRNFGPLPDTLRMLADLGYAQVEGFGGLYDSDDKIAALKSALNETGLAMPSAHFDWTMVSQDPGRAMGIARSLGVDTIIVPYLAPEDRPTDWVAFGRALAEAGKPIRDAGFAYGWHNHDFEFAPTGDGSLPLDQILAGGEEIGLEIDIAWVQVAGQSPRAFVEKYADRLVAVHLKDRAPEGECEDEGGWADLGHGVIDWREVIPAVEASTAKYLVMEHDNPSDDARFARRAIATANAF
ncbi:sugar phosphate isomerase/epimerase [Aliiruegeria haliotis]|uniref:Sugar phosphate isomerase/epimerase n=1 Tax=Aliiruegeria haliotis TaxID=1280846 RepID=A0A2T0RR91_9RHOB|nr:sugar phosphate isomerase/epimerase [Aliiruegeria haliotis]PRY23716.1 sugar phosphate isomerase/epimerase [Aliiruegeria haliotis]